MHKAVFSFELGKNRNLAVMAALKPESSRELPRAQARVWTEKETLRLEIRAEDAVSLRAAVNSYLRWVKVAADASVAGKAENQEANARASVSVEGGRGQKTKVGFKVKAEGKKSKGD